MILAKHIWRTTLAAVLALASGVRADEPTLETFTPVTANTADEPLAKEFSLSAATGFLDNASLEWTKTRKCFACHTNYAYLMIRPALSQSSKAHEQVRHELELMVTERWSLQGPRWDAEVIMTAVTLAYNDAATTGKLHATTRTALDRIWKVQREDGGFNWLKCNWPPMESDDHYGATIALVGVGIAPEGYADSPAAKAGIGKLISYLKANPPPTLHHKAMVLWASTCIDGVLSADEQQAVVKELLAAQKDNGGWAVASLGDWKRGDDKEQDTTNSDGYATGFSIFVLRQADVPADHAQVRKGIEWLKSNQRESGRWYTRSLFKDNKHFLSHAGSSYALLALDACGEIPKP